MQLGCAVLRFWCNSREFALKFLAHRTVQGHDLSRKTNWTSLCLRGQAPNGIDHARQDEQEPQQAFEQEASLHGLHCPFTYRAALETDYGHLEPRALVLKWSDYCKAPIPVLKAEPGQSGRELGDRLDDEHPFPPVGFGK